MSANRNTVLSQKVFVPWGKDGQWQPRVASQLRGEINQVIELLDHLPISPSVWGHYYKTGIPSWANKLIRISSPFLSIQNSFPFSSSESMLGKFLVSERS